MNFGRAIRSFAVLLFATIVTERLPAQSLSVQLGLQSSNAVLSLPAQLPKAGQGLVFPQYELQTTSDLLHWHSVGGKIQGDNTALTLSGPLLKTRLQTTRPNTFYRVIANLDATNAPLTGDGGADVFGYNLAIADELARIGQISPAQFAATYDRHPPYLPQLSWDPTTALYWDQFNIDPAAWNATNTTTHRINDFRLNPAELGSFMTNGFVVSERLGSLSFADSYYRVFHDDLPVFVTADSVLQAWHRNYNSMLEESEELQIYTLLQSVINGMSAYVSTAATNFGGTQEFFMPLSSDLGASIYDADYFLTVARSLLTGQTQNNSFIDFYGEGVTPTLTAINNLVPAQITIFGTNRWVDFSQFTVRGHYDDSERLRRYFRTVMWLSLADLRLKTYDPDKEDDIRELGTAVIFKWLLDQSGQYTNWAAIEQFTRAFVGETDSMTFAQLNDLLSSANIQSPGDVNSRAALTNLQEQLLTGQLGVQNIHSGYFFSPLNPAQVRLPRSFTVFGQKFIPDSWALSEVTFDSIRWTPDDGTNVMFGKVLRRRPSCLDVAFSIFGNDQVVANLVDRMTATNGERWRDGLPYQHNLAAVRNVIDSESDGVWTNNMYNAWLSAIRSLSAPTTDAVYPEAMRTRAWAMKSLNTQLASWTQLRHDTILYAKQSYSSPFACSYPYAFVEPRPEFWAKMKTLTDIASAGISSLPLSGTVTVPDRQNTNYTIQYDLAVVKSNQLACFQNFANTMLTLQDIAEKEQLQVPITPAETDFLKQLVEINQNCAGERKYTGWYPALFYKNVYQTDPYDMGQNPGKWDPVITDVHTDVQDNLTGDPGVVLHEAVGNVHLLMIAIDNGLDRMVYAGPALSHYEFEVPGSVRKTDNDWKTDLKAGTKPNSPEWTQSYLVPSPFVVPANTP